MDMRNNLYNRRAFLQTTGGLLASLGSWGFLHLGRTSSAPEKLMVLGLDGMDPTLLHTYMKQGLMPHCQRLIEMGSFARLRTSDPPQSPVAWSNFIAGTNPGGHGIFDFIARDSATIQPYLSTTRTTPSSRTLSIGKFSLPLSPSKVELLRKGPTLWKILQNAGIESTAFRAPVNFPPTETEARTLSGITTPDIHGSYGIFSLFSEAPHLKPGNVSGGQIERISIRDRTAECILKGPANTFREDIDNADVPFNLKINPERTIAYITIQSSKFLLREGEWSDWVTVKFPLIKYLAEVSGICRFYLKQTNPHVELYVSPVNIDPVKPAIPLSTPDDYAASLVKDVGYFYTQGFPEDTAALSAGVFNDDEFRTQATFVLEERLKFLEYELNRFHEGFFYFYFSSLDLNSHAFWRCIDPQHPLYTEELAREHGDYMPWLYGQLDQAVGRAMQHLNETDLLFVVSDHGFASFRRQFNLNSWLMDNGYAAPISRLDRGQATFFQNTDWSRTRAYGLGINSLYLNVRGREPDGIMRPGEEYEKIRTELIERLTAVRDPETGEQVMTHVYRPNDIYSGPYVDMAPDLIVGYNRHHRASWDTILGEYPREHILDNLDPWSGDHCMDAQFLSGVFLCNRNINTNNPALYDLATTILSAYNLPPPPEMIGKNLFG